MALFLLHPWHGNIPNKQISKAIIIINPGHNNMIIKMNLFLSVFGLTKKLTRNHKNPEH